MTRHIAVKTQDSKLIANLCQSCSRACPPATLQGPTSCSPDAKCSPYASQPAAQQLRLQRLRASDNQICATFTGRRPKATIQLCAVLPLVRASPTACNTAVEPSAAAASFRKQLLRSPNRSQQLTVNGGRRWSGKVGIELSAIYMYIYLNQQNIEKDILKYDMYFKRIR